MSYDKQRKPKTPPHATLRGLRKASGLTLDAVAAAVTEILKSDPAAPAVNRGTISAIESGLRGASVPMLNALAIAYGMEPGDIVTDYVPRAWNPNVVVDDEDGAIPEAVGL